MGNTRLISLLGLGFGDCGKGLFTDHLSRTLDVHTVVRFNGGAQAGHNVVLADGRHHTFSQFGSGSFVPHVVTVLAFPVIVHPTALLVEAEVLQKKGVHDCLDRLRIDGRCRVTTPFHQAAGRLRELGRGQTAHGSCGVGVGETVLHSIEYPEQVLRYADLQQPAAAMEKLDVIRLQLLEAFPEVCGAPENQAAYDAELAVLHSQEAAVNWLAQVAVLSMKVRPAHRDEIAARMHKPGTVLFEGAQGVLLDEWRGFHPHTTWSSISTEAVSAIAMDAGQTGKIRHFGLMRSYMTRHGAGPFPTWDTALNCLAEPHNDSGGWQGVFRRGHPDAVLLRYALSVAGKLDGIFVSHLDVLSASHKLRWCIGYEAGHGITGDGLCLKNPESGLIHTLLPGPSHDLDYQSGLTRLLHAARPIYEDEPIGGAEAQIEYIEDLATYPVGLASFGPTSQSVTNRIKFDG